MDYLAHPDGLLSTVCLGARKNMGSWITAL